MSKVDEQIISTGNKYDGKLMALGERLANGIINYNEYVNELMVVRFQEFEELMKKTIAWEKRISSNT